ncbi:MAG: serine protein kinase [Planctomycetota bacterium]|nr:serine protein kinase [Planctomycetota bacterium]
MSGSQLFGEIVRKQDVGQYQDLHWEGSFEDYLNIVVEQPEVTRNAYQRLYDMILSYGSEEVTQQREKITRYKFFDDPISNGRDGVFGLDKPLLRLVNILKAAAMGYGAERRVILLHGPVGSAKSTIARLLKKGVEVYSKTDAGKMYTFSWDLPDLHGEDACHLCPMNEEPLKLVPPDMRAEVERMINERSKSEYKVLIEGDLDPFCRYTYRMLMDKYDGDWKQVMKHIKVKRLVLSEKDRIGIGTFQPKDEKNQDSTELTGDINYRKIAEYGSDSDPRAFNFDGEFNIANRGVIEFIEMLKLDVAFLYDLLGASQEHRIKPKKFAQTDIDEVILGHTNEPEYRKLQTNELMEAFRDRTVKVDIPYNIRLSDELRIYRRDFTKERVKKHIAPHTVEMASLWAVLTRLEEPKKAQLNLLQKAKLYDGKNIPGFTEDHVIELKSEAPREGMGGISPRYIQDKISNSLVRHADARSLNPFMVLNELDEGLEHHSLIANEDQRKRYKELLAIVREEYEELAKNDVQRAISADEEAITKLCQNYIDNVKAYTQKERVRNKYTGQAEEPDERLMRSIEEKIEIPESRKDDFRRELMNYIGALAIEGRQFDYRMNDRLRRALEMKLFEDQKDSIKLSTLVSSVVDRETQEKIDVIKSRLIRNMGYDEESATDVLNFVASIFARGDTKKDKSRS